MHYSIILNVQSGDTGAALILAEYGQGAQGGTAISSPKTARNRHLVAATAGVSKSSTAAGASSTSTANPVGERHQRM